MSSLQDQLLKAGLVDKKKAKQASKDKRKASKVQRKSSQPVVDEVSEQVQQARAEKLQRDRELNAQRQLEADRKAIDAQIRQLVERNRIARKGGELAYNFADGKTVKKIFVTAEQQTALTRGRLAIVRMADDYELVPAPVADKIAERREDRVISVAPSSDTSDDDDYYAQFEIPDDLMW